MACEARPAKPPIRLKIRFGNTVFGQPDATTRSLAQRKSSALPSFPSLGSSPSAIVAALRAGESQWASKLLPRWDSALDLPQHSAPRIVKLAGAKAHRTVATAQPNELFKPATAAAVATATQSPPALYHIQRPHSPPSPRSSSILLRSDTAMLESPMCSPSAQLPTVQEHMPDIVASHSHLAEAPSPSGRQAAPAAAATAAAENKWSISHGGHQSAAPSVSTCHHHPLVTNGDTSAGPMPTSAFSYQPPALLTSTASPLRQRGDVTRKRSVSPSSTVPSISQAGGGGKVARIDDQQQPQRQVWQSTSEEAATTTLCRSLPDTAHQPPSSHSSPVQQPLSSPSRQQQQQQQAATDAARPRSTPLSLPMATSPDPPAAAAAASAAPGPSSESPSRPLAVNDHSNTVSLQAGSSRLVLPVSFLSQMPSSSRGALAAGGRSSGAGVGVGETFPASGPSELQIRSLPAPLPASEANIRALVNRASELKREGDRLMRRDGHWSVSSLPYYPAACLKYMEACEMILTLPRCMDGVNRAASLYGDTANLLWAAVEATAWARCSDHAREALRILCERLYGTCCLRQANVAGAKHYQEAAGQVAGLAARHAMLSLRGALTADGKPFQQHSPDDSTNSTQEVGGAAPATTATATASIASGGSGGSSAAAATAAAAGAATVATAAVAQPSASELLQSVAPRLVAMARQVSRFAECARRSVSALQAFVERPDVRGSAAARQACVHIGAVCMDVGVGDLGPLAAHANQALHHIRRLG